jgi:hypothetical protein
VSFVTGGRDMVRQPRSGKAVANENKYRYIVEVLVVDDELDGPRLTSKRS